MVIAIAALLLFACGRIPISQSPGGTASPARSSSPSATSSADPTANWITYTSSTWGYSVKHPESWIELGSLGAPDTEEYFSDEQVGSPSGLSTNGIFVAISIHQLAGQICSRHGIADSPIDRRDQLVIGGMAATLNVLSSPQPFMQLNVEHAGYCYMFSFVFQSSQVRDSDETTAQLTLSSFTFGQLTAAAP
jgi:hypothetical protein